jgi:hypothetical protein
MSAKMTAKEIKELYDLEGHRSYQDAADSWLHSLRTVYNWLRKGCPRKGESKRLRARLEAARGKRGAA